MPALSIAPIFPVRDVRASVAFYEKHLFFTTDFIMDDASYAVLHLDGRALHLTRTGDEKALEATARITSVYIDMTGVDDYEARVLATNPQRKHRALEEKPWGVKEFHILDLDGNLLRFGEDLAG